MKRILPDSEDLVVLGLVARDDMAHEELALLHRGREVDALRASPRRRRVAG